jgi:hypothetical protein
VARGAAPSSGGVLGPAYREERRVRRAIHDDRCEENRGGNNKLTRADRRTLAQMKCNGWGCILYMRTRREGDRMAQA